MLIPNNPVQTRTGDLTLWFIAITLIFPLFMQFSGGIYSDLNPIIDSGGFLSKLPLPISIGTCIFGIIALRRNYRQAAPSILFVAAFIAAILLSLIFAGEDLDIEARKMMFAAQTLLPTIGLLLGQLVRDEENVIPRAFLWVLLLLVPLQLLAGWIQGTLMLTNYLYVFSIYQHFQFVPIIFAMAFCLVMVHLWEQQKRLLRVLIPVMAIYVVASGSFLTVGLYCGFVLLFFGQRILRRRSGRLAGVLLFAMAIVAAIAFTTLYYASAKDTVSHFGDAGPYVTKFKMLIDGKMPKNIEERLGDWKMYGKWVVESDRTLLFGHVEPPARAVRTSAHNWYIDFIYNFGLVGLLPIFALIVFTAYRIWHLRKSLPPETWWLAGLVAFMVLIDSNFKVTLRQPYPGIFAYFFWGLLLSRLHGIAAPRAGA